MTSKTYMNKAYLDEFNRLVPNEWVLPASKERILIIRLIETPYDVISVIKNHIFFTTQHNWSITIVFDLEHTDMSLLKDIASRYKNINLVIGSKDTPITDLELPENSAKIYSDTKSFIVKMYDERSPYFINDTSHISDKNLFKLLNESIDDIRSSILSALSQTSPQYTDECLSTEKDKCLEEALLIIDCSSAELPEQILAYSSQLTHIDVREICTV